MKSVSYKKALEKIAKLEEYTPIVGKKLDSFDRSTLLAVIFDKDKDSTLDDILDVRSSGKYSKRLKKVI